MPAITQNVNPMRASAVSPVKLWADLTGAGAGAPTVSASTQLSPKYNFATAREGNTVAIVRNGAGDYTITFPTAPAVVLDVSAKSRGATNLAATVFSWTITSGRLIVQVKTWTPAGVATDLANGTDFMRIAIEGDLSNAYVQP